MQAENKTALWAGAFIIMTLLVLVALVFTLGSKQGLFGDQYALHTQFANVQGLVEGAPVRLAGLKVGIIESINFPQDISESIHVSLRIDDMREVRKRIRGDSVASIRSLGPLGEKYIEVSVGTQVTESLGGGDHLNAADPFDFYTVMDVAKDEFGKLARITSDFEQIMKDFRETRVLESLGKTVKSMEDISHEVVEGSGLLHSLIYDAGRKHILDHLADASRSFSIITKEIAEGDGSLHALIYKKEVDKISQNLALISADLHSLVREIKEGDGSLHSLIYDADVQQTVARLKTFSKDLQQFAEQINKSELAPTLAKAARNLERITDQVANGEGTIGALVNDPSLYDRTEDLLGGAQRSWMLRKVIKSSLKGSKKPAADKAKDKPEADAKKAGNASK